LYYIFPDFEKLLYFLQITPAGQFPPGFQQGQLPGAFGVNFAQFRPQYTIPGQGSAFPGTAPPENK